MPGRTELGRSPSVATLVRYTGLSERTVRTCLDRLEAEGIDLADAWLVTAEQRARLAPAVKAALDMGWTPSSPAAFTGANIDGVRSPYAVLTSRLSPAELPRPIGHGPPRPPWCGQCDQATRMLGFDGDAPRPVPALQAISKARRSRRKRPFWVMPPAIFSILSRRRRAGTCEHSRPGGPPVLQSRFVM
jgi:hypothetical protein